MDKQNAKDLGIFGVILGITGSIMTLISQASKDDDDGQQRN